MNPRVKGALLWGVVGLLSFLVLLQGYELLEGIRVDLGVKAGAAIAVFAASSVLTYLSQGRLPASDPEPTELREEGRTGNEDVVRDANEDEPDVDSEDEADEESEGGVRDTIDDEDDR